MITREIGSARLAKVSTARGKFWYRILQRDGGRALVVFDNIAESWIREEAAALGVTVVYCTPPGADRTPFWIQPEQILATQETSLHIALLDTPVDELAATA